MTALNIPIDRDVAEAEAPLTAYFGQDCTDSAVIRRIASIRAAGHRVVGFTFRRDKYNRDYVPEWDDVPLGASVDRHYRARLPALLRAARTVWRERRRVRPARVIVARNLDQALLALFARLVSGSRAAFAYEVLDVQRAFLRDDALGRALRWAERRVLARADMLVVSSPAFVREYFAPVQGFRGPWHLLENKICAAQPARAPAPAPPPTPGRGGRWAVGWFGTLRCERSLRVLAALADALPDRVEVVLRGLPTETGLGPFLDVVGRRPNMRYGGEYRSPADLPDLYGSVHLAWGLDFLDAGTNSRWLLPNRLYDAGSHGVPLLALRGTETGDRVERDGLGWALEEPLAERLVEWLGALTDEEWERRRAHVRALPRSMFLDTDDVPDLLRRLGAPAPAAGSPPRDGGPGGHDALPDALHPEADHQRQDGGVGREPARRPA